jgi:hypothetical protein
MGMCHVDPTVSVRQAFDPETIDKMLAALQSVCDSLVQLGYLQPNRYKPNVILKAVERLKADLGRGGD